MLRRSAYQKELERLQRSFREMKEETLMLQHAIRLLPLLPANSSRLDIGCNNLKDLLLTVHEDGKRVVGIDIDLKVLRDAEKGNIDVVNATAFNLPFKNKSFDCVSMFCTLSIFAGSFMTPLVEAARVADTIVFDIGHTDHAAAVMGSGNDFHGSVKEEIGTLFTLDDGSQTVRFDESDVQKAAAKIGFSVSKLVVEIVEQSDPEINIIAGMKDGMIAVLERRTNKITTNLI